LLDKGNDNLLNQFQNRWEERHLSDPNHYYSQFLRSFFIQPPQNMISLFDSILKQDTSIDFYGDQSMLSQISTQHTLIYIWFLFFP